MEHQENKRNRGTKDGIRKQETEERQREAGTYYARTASDFMFQ